MGVEPWAHDGPLAVRAIRRGPGPRHAQTWRKGRDLTIVAQKGRRPLPPRRHGVWLRPGYGRV